MQEIKCPKCGEVFQVDESGYAAIARHERDDEFNKEIAQRERAMNAEKTMAVDLAEAGVKNEKDGEIARLKAQLQAGDAQKRAALSEADARRQMELSRKDAEIEQLKGRLVQSEAAQQLAVQSAVQGRVAQIAEL